MDLSVCNYIRIQNPYVKITYDSFTYRFLPVCNDVLYTDFVCYIRILTVCNLSFSCSACRLQKQSLNVNQELIEKRGQQINIHQHSSKQAPILSHGMIIQR